MQDEWHCRIRRMAEEIVGREDGSLDDPADPGGAGNTAVSIQALRRLGMDAAGDCRVSEADVPALSRDQTVEIFIRHYFHQPRIDLLPGMLWPTVFDMHVNAGANAVRILQRLLNRMGQAVAVDGIIGPQTVRAARAAARAAPDQIVDAYGIARRDYYYAIADRRPASRRFACRRDGGKGGWIRRAEDFISPRYHLSEAEHRERTAAWSRCAD